MGTGYTRNDTANNIADGNVINASDLDGEFDAVQAAFNASTGHSHDGTLGEGPQIDASGIADNAVALGTKTTGNYVATGAVSGVGLSGSASAEGATFTVTSNATNANTGSTIVARDSSGNFSAGTITAALTGDVTGNLTGNVTGNLTGNVTGNLTGDVTGNVSGTAGSATGNAATATALETARNIGGVSFDGTGNIDLPGVNTAGNQNTSGNAATATALETARTIHGVSFDGTGNIDLSEVVQDTVGAMFTGNTETGITATYQDSDGTIDLAVGTLNQNTTGNAATATALETARTIAGQSFNGTGNITIASSNLSDGSDLLKNVVEDTTPQLGGNLDLNSSDITGTGNIDNTGTVTTDGLTVAGNVSVDGGTIKLDGNYPVGTGNVALGNDAASNASLGNFNTAIGDDALKNCTGERNTAVGYNAGESVSAGSNNTFIGENTGNNTNGTDISSCTAVGASAFQEGAGNRNTAIGNRAMMRGGASGTNSVAVGYGSQSGSESVLVSNYTGTSNTSVGSNSLSSNKTGYANVAIGFSAMGDAETDCDQNVAIGNAALGSITASSSLNTAIGHGAGSAITSGQKNTILGSYNGNEGGLDITTSDNNVVLSDGDGNIRMRIDSSGNVGIGTSSPTVSNGKGLVIADATAARLKLCDTTTGEGASDGVQLGHSGGVGFLFNHENEALQFGTNNTERMRIDSVGGLRLGTTSNILNAASDEKMSVKNAGLGHAATFQVTNVTGGFPILYLDSQDTTNTSQNTISIRRGGSQVGGITTSASSTAYNTTSDHRLKENVAEMTGAITRVKSLQPKRFNFIADDSVTVDGFMAHEAQAVVPEAVTGTHNEVDADGNAVMQGIDQSKLVPLLTGALQEAIAKIETLETKVAALEAGN